MESVIFDGKEFVKASVLAEKFRYTQDYLGQLCRGKKVDARLVGRAWYINLDSLHSHRTARYKSGEKAPEAEVIKASNHYLSRIDVEPVLKQKTVKILKAESGKYAEFSMKYEGDDHSLIPRVNKSAISSFVPIIPAEAKNVKVHQGKDVKNITNFKAEPLPEVFLSGTLKVQGIEEETQEATDETPSNEETSSEVLAEITKRPAPIVKIRTLRRPVATPNLLPSTTTDSKPTINPHINQTVPLEKTSKAVSNTKHPPHTFTPATLTVKKPVVIEHSPSLLIPTATVLAGLISGFFILTTEVSLEASADTYTDDFVIRAENVSQAAKVIFSKIP